MDNNFYDGSNNNSIENNNSFGDNSFSGSNYQSYTNTNNSFDSSLYNGYVGNSADYDYAQNQPIPNNSYENNFQNQSAPNNTYNGYPQNNYQNNQYGCNNPNLHYGYQNNNYPGDRYVDGIGGYSNGNEYNNQYNNNATIDYHEFLDSSDPVGAEVIYKDENQNSKLFGKGFWIIFLGMFFIVPFGNMFPDNSVISTITTFMVPMLMVGIFLYIVINTIISPVITSFKKKRRCTQPIIAKIVDVRITRGSKGHRHYHPTYKYSYAGKIYIIAANTSRGIERPQVGRDIQMMINHDDPSDYYIEAMSADIIMLIVGIMFTFVPIISLVIMIISMFLFI